MKILLVRKLGRNSMTLKLNISLRPFDLLCTSAEKLGFFLLLTAAFCFSHWIVLTYLALKNSLMDQAPESGAKWKAYTDLAPVGLRCPRLSWALNVVNPYWIRGFPKYFSGILVSKGRMLRSGERERIILLCRIWEGAWKDTGPRSVFLGTEISFVSWQSQLRAGADIVGQPWLRTTPIWSDSILLVRFKKNS